MPAPRPARPVCEACFKEAKGGDWRQSLRGIDAGPLANSVVAEALTSALIWINRKYKVPDAGIRITGLDAVVGR